MPRARQTGIRRISTLFIQEREKKKMIAEDDCYLIKNHWKKKNWQALEKKWT